MILFTNPGELDIRAATTLGVNVKENDSPIGFFGTGLKYAIAVLLRGKAAIHIYSGNKCYHFRTKTQEIRGKSFDFIEVLEHQKDGPEQQWRELGFTTELGKTWELWQVYRELYSNTEDEHGEIHKIFTVRDALAFIGPEQTAIVIDSPEFDKTHDQRREFLLDKDAIPLLKTDEIEIYSGINSAVFYKGIKASKLAKPSRYTYNLIRDMRLTEDRTLLDQSTVDYIVGTKILLETCDKEILRTLLTSGDGYWESTLYCSSISNPSDEFFEVVGSAFAADPMNIHKRALEVYQGRKDFQVKEHIFREPTEEENAQLKPAIALAKRMGFPVDQYPIRHAESLGRSILALAYKGEILLCADTYRVGQVLEALIEEYIHLSTGYGDKTFQMQNKLISEIIRLGKELQK